MEDKKTLWIIFGIGVCVLVVSAVGFFWFLPEDSATASAGDDQAVMQAGKSGFDPVEWVRKEETYPGLEEKDEESDEFIVVSDELVYGVPEASIDDGAADAAADEKVVTIAVPERTPEPEPAAVIQPAAVQRTRPVQAQPAPRKAVTKTEYWIQAGSFSSLQKANDVKSHLGDLGTASTVSTTTVNGTNYYRVRLGPYGEKMEAAKFLDWIKAVDGFEGSYVSEVYVTK